MNPVKFFGGIPRVIVPDNLRSGVTHPDCYEPDVNHTYQEMTVHYNAVVLPARVRKPRDKAKVEEAVQNSERRILAKFRDRLRAGGTQGSRLGGPGGPEQQALSEDGR